MRGDLCVIAWWNVEQRINRIAEQLRERLKGATPVGVYGEPRGGLIPAVILSHKLELPLLDRRQDGMVWVDDIFDTGRTYRTARDQWQMAAAAVLVTKEPHASIVHGSTVESDKWVVFPWEEYSRAIADREAYLASRQ